MSQNGIARGMLVSDAQVADPRRNPEYWEAAHGNEETFRKMSRIKRSVQASFSTVNHSTADMENILDNIDPEQALEIIANQKGFDLGGDLHFRKQTPHIHGSVQPQKRPAPTASSF
jgi:hypothetical protein